VNPPAPQIYVTSLEEVLWGAALVALTMVMHGLGMLSVLRVQLVLKQRFHVGRTFATGMLRVVLASWMILLVHLLEVFLWASFFFWKGSLNSPNANFSLCYYFSLNEYTTLGSDYDLIFRWRLLEGMISVAGLMTFAWSTGVLFTLVQNFQQHELLTLEQRPPNPIGPSIPIQRATPD
jgi:hypothetical protein